MKQLRITQVNNKKNNMKTAQNIIKNNIKEHKTPKYYTNQQHENRKQHKQLETT